MNRKHCLPLDLLSEGEGRQFNGSARRHPCTLAATSFRTRRIRPRVPVIPPCGTRGAASPIDSHAEALRFPPKDGSSCSPFERSSARMAAGAGRGL